jgi:hypothetical protein
MLFNHFYDTLPPLIKTDTKFRDSNDNSNNQEVKYWTS